MEHKWVTEVFAEILFVIELCHILGAQKTHLHFRYVAQPGAFKNA